MHDRPDDARITACATAAGAGDRTALAEFVRSTQRDVHRFLTHLSGAADADDLAQETYLRALGALPRFEARAPARTWLLAIARHVAADAVRSAQRRPRTDGVDDWDTVVAAALARPAGRRPGLVRSAADEAVALRALVDALDTDRREAFVLTQLLDLSYAEAAEVCACPVGTIRSRVARAREDLVEAMEGSAPRRKAEG